MQGLGTQRVRVLRTLVRAADAIAHNRERRRMIHRYRRVDCVVLVPAPGAPAPATARVGAAGLEAATARV